MSDFVEQCRREWKRLGVPDPLAEEMAADLASDLGEAEAEGVSAEELLGSSVFDPRSFAASWAAERGIIPDPPKPRNRASQTARSRRVHRTGGDRTARFSVAAPDRAAQNLGRRRPEQHHLTYSRRRRAPYHPAPAGWSSSTSASTPVEWILLLLAIVALGFAAWLWSSWGRTQPPGAPA